MAHALARTGHDRTNLASPWMRGLAAGAIAAVLNALIFLVGKAIDLIPESVVLSTPSGEGSLTIGPVILMSLVPALVAVAVYLLVGRLSSRPARTFRIVGGVLLVLSLLMPFGIPEVPLKMALLLDLMHVVSGVAILLIVPLASERG